MPITEEQVKEWEKLNHPWKLIDGSKNIPVSKKSNLFKNIAIIVLIIVALGFLSLFALRTYYYENFNDNFICEPTTNIEPTQCSDVNVQCGECINATEMQTLLNSVSCSNIEISLAGINVTN